MAEDGRRWRLHVVPGIWQVAAASAVSSDDIWAVAGIPAAELQGAPASPAAVMRWNGSRWIPVPIPQVLARHGHLISIIARSDHDVWVSGALGHGGAWATGICANCRPAAALAWHLAGGRWSAPLVNFAGHHTFPIALAQAGRTSSVWGVGEQTLTREYAMVALYGPTPR
jgi:hypothetical protein